MNFRLTHPKKTGESSSERFIIGVDVGGTKIRSGAIAVNGALTGEPFTIPTGGSDSKDDIIGRIIESINAVIRQNRLSKNEIQAIGMGVTGPLDNINGLVLECPQLPSLHFYPLRRRIKDEFGIPVFMDNDANALILAECLWGAGRGSSIVLGFTLGTGLGCAVVIEGKIQSGKNGMAGEIWMSPYKDGTIEDYVSGNGISRIYGEHTGINMPAMEIAELARQGDENARASLNEFGKAVGFAAAWSINIIDPDVVILGGSITKSMELFENSMNTFIRRHVCPVPAQKTFVVKALLGDNAGYMGSAALALRGFHA